MCKVTELTYEEDKIGYKIINLYCFRPVGSKFEMVRPYYSAKRARIMFWGTPTSLPPHTALFFSPF